MWQNLEPGSSPIDWCEGNYRISPVIAEFTNTLSNILFLLLPPVLIHLFREYGRFVNPCIHLIWILLMVVGMCSAYFHATLSFIGQLLDELAILWVLAAALAMFFPRRHFPSIFKNDRRKFVYFTISFAIVATGLAFLYPFANAFALMAFSIAVVVLLYTELKRNQDVRVQRLGNRCAIAWVLAASLWTTDRMFCSTWLSLDFPYLHALFHICIFIVSYTACVLFAFFAVKDERPDLCPTLKYWPRDHFELGVPYVTVKNGNHQI